MVGRGGAGKKPGCCSAWLILSLISLVSSSSSSYLMSKNSRFLRNSSLAKYIGKFLGYVSSPLRNHATYYSNCISVILDASSKVVLAKDNILVTLRGQRDADPVFHGYEIGRRELRLSVRSLKIFYSFESWLPDGYCQIFRSYVFGPSGFWTMAPLRCKI